MNLEDFEDNPRNVQCSVMCPQLSKGRTHDSPNYEDQYRNELTHLLHICLKCSQCNKMCILSLINFQSIKHGPWTLN